MTNLCPICRVAMEQISATAATELSVYIDQCPNCGGFWFDNKELFVAPAEIAEEYDSVITKGKKIGAATQNPICPRCELPLILLKDPELSKRIQLDICPKCMGLWLDKSEFLQYKEYQKEKMEKVKKEDAIRATETLKKLQQSKETSGLLQFLISDSLISKNVELFLFVGQDNRRAQSSTK